MITKYKTKLKELEEERLRILDYYNKKGWDNQTEYIIDCLTMQIKLVDEIIRDLEV